MRGEGHRRNFPYRRFFVLSAGLVIILTAYLHFIYFPRLSTLSDGADRQRTVARVTEKRVEREENGQEVHRITFQFRTVDGRAVTGEARVEAPRYRATRVGDEVSVEYSLKDPHRHHLMEPSAVNAAPSEPAP